MSFFLKAHTYIMATQAQRFARCVKNVTRKVKLKKKLGNSREGAAIAICTKAILHPQRRTIRRFYMKGKKPVLITQNMFR